MAFKKGLSSGNFREALTLYKKYLVNEIWMRVENHIDVDDISQEKGFMDMWSKQRTNEGQRD